MTTAPPLPAGFSVAGLHCGVKSDSGKPDLSLYVADRPCTSAGVFTTNRIVGAPVIVSRGRVGRTSTRGVVINSGNANACTGERGLEDARTMTSRLAAQIGCDPDDVLVCSTGIIGQFLPMDAVTAGIPQAFEGLGTSDEHVVNAARGMMTTDTVPKLASRRVTLSGGEVFCVAFTKGAAMIAPNMATMLSVILTDAVVDVAAAATLLKSAVDASFNCISIDGHTSTSDSVLLLASGASGVGLDAEGDSDVLSSALTDLATEAARSIVADAEGGSHVITVEVVGTATESDARVIAKTVAESALVKTAVAGNDPNWGRVVSAAGYAGVEFADQNVSLDLNGVTIYESGRPLDFDEPSLSRSMSEGNVHFRLRFDLGDASARCWSSDLTTEYVRLNSEYTT